MELQLETPSTNFYLKSYKPGQIVTNEKSFNSSIILTPYEMINSAWQTDQFEQLTIESCEEILALESEIILLGTGSNIKIPDNDIFKAFFKKNKSLEFMDSHAACRTFNILAAEERSVAAAIIAN